MPELLVDPRFADFTARGVHRGEILAILEERFAQRTAVEWVDDLRAAGVPTGPINSVEQALAEEHTIARGLIATTEHEYWGEVSQVVSPVRFGAQRPVYRRAPRRNEHFDDVVERLGYTPQRVRELVDGGAFGDPMPGSER